MPAVEDPATTHRPRQDEAATAALGEWFRAREAEHADPFELARAFAPRLGAHPAPDGTVTFAMWTPRLTRERVAEADVFLEVLAPIDDLDVTVSRATVRFRRTLVPVQRDRDLVWTVARGLAVGTREHLGSFYCLTYRDRDGDWHRVFDPMATSLPYGAFAPAEVYDLDRLRSERGDRDYWQALAAEAGEDRCGSGIVKQGPAANIMQLHVPTATSGGTLASLARFYERMARHIREGRELTPEEQVYSGYDAVQLLPVEPTTVYETGPAFFEVLVPEEVEATEGIEQDLRYLDEVTAVLRRPDTTNWGYDVVIAGSAAVNPTLLETGRPDELVDLAVALHTFPGRPIRLIADVVYGHADNQALDVLDSEWFAGPNMYGQNLDYRNPWVRALLLEMQRRKVDLGFDGVRVDGAQDFKFYDAEARELRHDDRYLQQMSDLVQDVAGCRYRPWMIFEDGRPWPEPDWELSSTYRAVIEDQPDPDIFQWGPLTFAHNTPFVYGFWLRSWWRIRQILEHGSTWISGCANHDTLRRGTQVSPELTINTRLGETELQILDKAYDNPAIKLLTYCALPGVPMDFLNASMRAAWGFIRNQDDRYGVKVVSEETISLVWQVDEEFYPLAANFKRLKALGFETLEELRRFVDLLPALVEVTDYDLDTISTLINGVEPPLAGPLPMDPPTLKRIARAWMDDMHDYCNVHGWANRLDPRQTEYNVTVREFRRARRWLRDDLRDGDAFDYLRPVDGHAVFASLRTSPDGREQVLLVANMEGGHAELDPVRVDLPGLDPEGWYLRLRTPNIGSDYLGGPITLNDSSGVVFTRER
ncbi:MAG: glucosylglycerol hydrolase [Nitriliruptoraceae bacterium]